MSARWLVQRRLPGVQGENGCWSDVRVIEAHSAEAALLAVSETVPDHMLHGGWRVAVEPDWEWFTLRSETTTNRNVVAVAAGVQR